jgi:hypothetical protein
MISKAHKLQVSILKDMLDAFVSLTYGLVTVAPAIKL